MKNVLSSLNNLKSKVDKSDIGKLKTTPVDLTTLTNAVKSDVVKKTEYIEFVKKVSIINISTTDTSDLVKKTDYNTKISEIENKTNDHDHVKYITAQELNIIKFCFDISTSKSSKQK